MTKIALTNYLLKVSIYKRKDLDFFVFLLLQISLKSGDENLLKNVIKECEIPDSLMYLFEMAYYYCIDNELLNSSNNDFETVKVEELSITKSGEKALKDNCSLSKVDTKEIDLSINPLNNSLVAFKDTSNVKEYELIEKAYSEDEINAFINNKKIELFNDKTNDFYYICKILRVLPTII